MDNMDYDDIERLDRDKKGSIPTPTKVIILLAVIAGGFVSSFSPMSLIGILCTAMAAGGFAYLIRVQKMYLSVIAAPLAVLAGMAVSGDFNAALPACVFAFPAIGIIAARNHGRGRSEAALFGSLLIGAAAAEYFACIIYGTAGSLNREIIGSYVDEVFSLVKDDFLYLGLDEDAAGMMTSYFRVLSPSVVGVMLLAVSYFSGSCYGFFCRVNRDEDEISDWKLKMSVVSAVVYILLFASCAILSCIEQNAVFFGLTNVEVMLTPAFVIVGFSAYREFLRNRREAGKNNLLPIVLSVLLILFNIYGFAAMLAFIGAVDIIIKELTKLSDRS